MNVPCYLSTAEVCAHTYLHVNIYCNACGYHADRFFQLDLHARPVVMEVAFSVCATTGGVLRCRNVTLMGRRGGGKSKKGRTPKNRSARPAPTPKTNPTEAAMPADPSTPLPVVDMILDVTEVAVMEQDSPRLTLPDLPKPSTRGARRRRRKQPAASSAPTVDPMKEEEALPTSEIERLTQAYRKGGEAARELLSKIEVEPDYMFRSGQAKDEYELAAAIIGTGRPNKQGVFVQPYLQSSHIVLLGVILLGTFVYYPGFPLTSGSEELREMCRTGLAIVFSVNAALAVYAYGDARKRGQPSFFWAAKVALLGNIALQELRGNAPLQGGNKKKKGKAKK